MSADCYIFVLYLYYNCTSVIVLLEFLDLVHKLGLVICVSTVLHSNPASDTSAMHTIYTVINTHNHNYLNHN